MGSRTELKQLIVYRLKGVDKRGYNRMRTVVTRPNAKLPENALYPESITVKNIADAIPMYKKLPIKSNKKAK
jgi:hypothetical protein